MIFDKMYRQGLILETGMQAASYKNQVILNNMANADTPGFKKQTVDFENILDDVLKTEKLMGNLNLSSAKPRVRTVNPNLKTRIDENNFDIETEQMEFYKNSTKYDVLVNSVTSNSARLNTVLTSIK